VEGQKVIIFKLTGTANYYGFSKCMYHYFMHVYVCINHQWQLLPVSKVLNYMCKHEFEIMFMFLTLSFCVVISFGMSIVIGWKQNLVLILRKLFSLTWVLYCKSQILLTLHVLYDSNCIVLYSFVRWRPWKMIMHMLQLPWKNLLLRLDILRTI
jgi:hypothetical protein